MRSASRRPKSRFVAGVYGKNPVALAASIGSHAQYDLRQRADREAGERLLADRVEAQARRQHQALLRAGERDVDAPLVVTQVDRRERRHRVDEQQRRMPGAIDRLPDLGQPAGHAGRGLVVHDEHRPDAVVAILASASPRRSPDRRRASSRRARPRRRGRAACATSAQSRANSPISNASTLSPGDSVLTSAASHAPVPDDGKDHDRARRLEDAPSGRRAPRGRARRTRRCDDRWSAAPSRAARDRARWSARESGGSDGRLSMSLQDCTHAELQEAIAEACNSVRNDRSPTHQITSCNAAILQSCNSAVIRP